MSSKYHVVIDMLPNDHIQKLNWKLDFCSMKKLGATIICLEMIQISFFCHAFRNASERFKAECQTHLWDDVIFSLTLGILRLMTHKRKQSETLKVQVKTLKKHFFLFFGNYYHSSPLKRLRLQWPCRKLRDMKHGALFNKKTMFQCGWGGIPLQILPCISIP